MKSNRSILPNLIKGAKKSFVNFDWWFGNFCSIKQLSKSTLVGSFVLTVPWKLLFQFKSGSFVWSIKWLLTRIVFIDKEAIFRVLLTQIVVRKDKIFWSKVLTWSSSNFISNFLTIGEINVAPRKANLDHKNEKSPLRSKHVPVNSFSISNK